MNARDFTRDFPNIAFERRGDVLALRLHTRQEALKWGAIATSVHAQLGRAFYEVAHDRSVRVVILTGTGAAFCTEMDFSEMPPLMNDEEWGRLTQEGRDLIMNLLDIEVPVITAVNGPAYIHAELAVLGDVVLAAQDAEFADLAHFPSGVVPGDSAQVVWPALLGPNRGRYFLMTGQRIGATEAQALGVVAEVLPRERLMTRAWQLAEQFAAKPASALRNTRAAFTYPLKKRMLEELSHGLALEGLGLLAITPRQG
jgi:enoyl-CoA hydratase/carnithine racemase